MKDNEWNHFEITFPSDKDDEVEQKDIHICDREPEYCAYCIDHECFYTLMCEDKIIVEVK